eukprot:g82545.t1
MGQSFSHGKEFAKEYSMGGKIGAGTFATVRKVTRKSDKKAMAAKIILRAAMETKENSSDDEVEIMKSANHPNIIKMQAIFETKTKVILVLELMDGDLADKLDDVFTERQAAKITQQIAAGLDYLHKHGITHRDLKPLCVFGYLDMYLTALCFSTLLQENVLLNSLKAEYPEAKLTDLDIYLTALCFSTGKCLGHLLACLVLLYLATGKCSLEQTEGRVPLSKSDRLCVFGYLDMYLTALCFSTLLQENVLLNSLKADYPESKLTVCFWLLGHLLSCLENVLLNSLKAEYPEAKLTAFVILTENCLVLCVKLCVFGYLGNFSTFATGKCPLEQPEGRENVLDIYLPALCFSTLLQENVLLNSLKAEYPEAKLTDLDIYLTALYFSTRKLLGHENVLLNSLKGEYPEAKLTECESVLDIYLTALCFSTLLQENVLLNSLKAEYPEAKLTDFGTAKICKDSQLMKSACGSPSYVAPEILNRKKYGPKVDIWALGIILYRVLSGELPFVAKDGSRAKLYNMIKRGEVKFKGDVWKNVEPSKPGCAGVQDLILKLLNSDPEKRPSAEEVLQHDWIVALA